jgi:hypothetical protein
VAIELGHFNGDAMGKFAHANAATDQFPQLFLGEDGADPRNPLPMTIQRKAFM